MLRKFIFAILIVFILTPSISPAAFKHESILKADIEAAVLDVTTNPDGDLIFVLTPGSVLIYSAGDQSILDRIPLDSQYDRIAYQNDDRLVLTSAKPSKINIISFSRIYDFDLTNRAVRGAPKAKVTMVVFDDYQ
jgi:hypothetical protein